MAKDRLLEALLMALEEEGQGPKEQETEHSCDSHCRQRPGGGGPQESQVGQLLLEEELLELGGDEGGGLLLEGGLEAGGLELPVPPPPPSSPLSSPPLGRLPGPLGSPPAVGLGSESSSPGSPHAPTGRQLLAYSVLAGQQSKPAAHSITRVVALPPSS